MEVNDLLDIEQDVTDALDILTRVEAYFYELQGLCGEQCPPHYTAARQAAEQARGLVNQIQTSMTGEFKAANAFYLENDH